jgi:integrase
LTPSNAVGNPTTAETPASALTKNIRRSGILSVPVVGDDAWIGEVERVLGLGGVGEVALHRLSGGGLDQMNPCRRPRKGSSHRPERPWASAEQVDEIAARVTPPNQALIITAAYTGMRWGELAGLRRHNCKLDGSRIFIDPDEGNLHEVGGRLTLGAPKTPAAVRDILLPPFLVDLLRAHLDSHSHDHVFIGRDGGLHRRSSFHRRHWRPATDGNPANGAPAVIRGLHFHDLRHSHKTWLIEDGVPEVAQAKRLGHRLPGVRGIYSHVSTAVEQRLVDGLQARWKRHAPK